MSISSVLNAGLAGMQSSQREMAKAADDIAKAALPLKQPEQIGMSPAPANNADLVVRNESDGAGSGDLVEPLIEMRRQEHLFTASAKMVAIADKTLGSLIDVTS